MNIKLIKGTHITATDKRHMRHLLSKDIQPGETGSLGKGKKCKHYEFEEINSTRTEARVNIYTWELSDWGEGSWRRQRVTIAISYPRKASPKAEQVDLLARP